MVIIFNQKMIIAFHTPAIDVRGTCVAVYDYAYYNETLLGNQSIIITPDNGKHDIQALVKFNRRFRILYYSSVNNLDNILIDHNCDILYCIKYGKRDGIESNRVKTVVHCVFDMTEPHGAIYAGVSETLARKFNRKEYVPHMVGLKSSTTGENMRKWLGIPESATVLGRHGGQDTFDLDIAKRAINSAVNTRSDLYFLFVNTPKFMNHDRVIFLDKIVDVDEKTRFICTCDGMIHAQSLGETFGLSIAEFSINNKPIITFGGPVWNAAYRDILGDRAIYYYSQEDCHKILINFDKIKYQHVDLNCYRDYSPERVMGIFKRVFIDGL